MNPNEDRDEIRNDPDDLQPGPPPEVETEGEGIWWGAIFFLLWAVVLIIFSLQNADSTTIAFLGWSWQLPVALLVLLTALVTLVTASLSFAFYRRRRRRHRALRRAASRSGE